MSDAKTPKLLTGNTYPHRDEIRSIGGTWDAARKGWVIQPGTMSERSRQSAVINSLKSKGVKVEYA